MHTHYVRTKATSLSAYVIFGVEVLTLNILACVPWTAYYNSSLYLDKLCTSKLVAATRTKHLRS